MAFRLRLCRLPGGLQAFRIIQIIKTTPATAMRRKGIREIYWVLTGSAFASRKRLISAFCLIWRATAFIANTAYCAMTVRSASGLVILSLWSQISIKGMKTRAIASTEKTAFVPLMISCHVSGVQLR